MESLLSLSRILRSKSASTKDVQHLLYGKRKNAVHSTSRGKPSAALLLTKVPNEKIAHAAKRALALQELSRDDILSVLKSNRALRRLDRSAILVEALREDQYSLQPHHYATLMAHANDQRDTAKALSFWEMAVKEGKVTDKLHGALLATYKNAGRWQDAVQHCEEMWEDKLVLDPHALHAVLNACRRHGPWESALAVFSKAVDNGTRPNNVVYLELLRTVEHAVGLPSRWKYALAILDALHGKIDVTAGHYNAALATMSGPRLWEKGVELFESMKTHSVQPSRDTLNQLLLLNPGNVAHCIRCVAEAHALGLPVTDTMYRAVVSNLFRMELDHEASQFVTREYRRDIDDPGHSATTTLSLSFALIDSLLAHPRPRDAIVFYEAYETKLGDVVGAATRTLGTLGEPSQRWLVQGRVAVVDHNIILSPRMESLMHHYDSVFIPFSSVRLLVRRVRQMGTGTQGQFTRYALLRLERLLRQGQWGQVGRVLPLSHQLQAHQYLVGGPTTPEALQQLRDEAGRLEGGAAAQPTLGQRLLESIREDTERQAAPGPASAGPENALASPPMHIRSVGTIGQDLPPVPQRSPSGAARPVSVTPFTLQEGDRLSSTERVLAVAVMLKSLNPTTDIHLLSTNATQLAIVEKWNRCKPHAPLTAVRYPHELFEKAPPAEVDTNEASAYESNSNMATSSKIDETDQEPLDFVDGQQQPLQQTPFLSPS